MSDAEFDRHAGHYRQVHERNIAVSGELPEYFAEYKMRDFAHLIRGAGLAENGRFLDFGSGIGSSIVPFLSHLPQAHLSCADVSSESLLMSHTTHGEKAEYLLMQDGHLPVDDASFDGAFACCVFHHIDVDEHRKVLTELRRVIKPAGLLMIYEHNPLNPLTVRSVKTCPLDENAVLISARDMCTVCIDAGWKQVHFDYRVFFPAALKHLRRLENHLRWLPLGAQYCVSVRA